MPDNYDIIIHLFFSVLKAYSSINNFDKFWGNKKRKKQYIATVLV